MAASLLNFLTAVALLFSVAGPALGQTTRDEPIDFRSDGGYEVDFKSGKTIMHKVSVSQGDVSITAERAEATGLDFENSRWVFIGDVRIRAEKRGSLRAESAEVEFRSNRIARATIRGSPAEFEQKRAASDQMARGRAGEILYEVSAGTVRFGENAWLTYGGNEMSGPALVYDIRQEKVRSDERVRITIIPKASDGGRRPHPSPPPATGGGDSSP